ncbi:AraC family transcriptional regulator [Ancylobacter dichloromethanicus]|uniref:AraC family transcriptional regulator n=1 Tax=Ancylobacter dichloromethanicus TaxID=518825 RepID=A0A9W6MZI8_9HYPH|nr:AraC family transcriptional regulator [Ancylobacter dichloromethanicus]
MAAGYGAALDHPIVGTSHSWSQNSDTMTDSPVLENEDKPSLKMSGLYRLQRVSTTDFDPSDRFDAWRETAYSIADLEVPADDEAELFGTKYAVRGAIGNFACHAGSLHRTVVSRATRLSGALDAIIISLMAEGCVGLESPGGEQPITPTGRLVAYDATKAMRYHWSVGKEIYIVLPRAKALEAFGGELPGLVLPLDTIPLGVMVRDHMAALDRHAEHLDLKEMAIALDALHTLALLLLQRIGRGLSDWEQPDPNALFLAAKRYIRANYNVFDLSPEAIALAVGCSRATLYRAFTQNDTTIMDTVRDIRLAMSRRLIEADTGRSISVIAYDCGFKDASSFGKLFRSRFGVSPGAWRGKFS